MTNIMTIGGKTVADIQIGGKTVQSIYDNTHSVLLWEQPSAAPDYFYFEDRSGAANSVTLAATLSGSEWVSLEYSTDGSSWSTWDISQSLSIAANGRVYLRGDSGRTATNSSNTHTFSSTGDVYAGGNAVTLVSVSAGVQGVNLNHAFCRLFNGMTTLVGVSDTLFQGITSADTGTFRETFGGCSRLANVPSLAISSLAADASDTFRSTFYQCYALTDASNITFGFTTTYTRTLYQTFTGCSALVTPPDLSSITTLGTNALQAAFSGCASLASLRVGFTDWGDGTATRNWTRNITGNGVFTCPTALPLIRNSADGTTTADYIPYNWSIVGSDGSLRTPYIFLDENCDVKIENFVGGNSVVYYTTDGSTPTTSSSVYSAPFAYSQGMVVKAIVVSGSASQPSDVYVFPPDGVNLCDYYECIGYSTYEECDCAENGNCEGGDDTVDCGNYLNYGYPSEDECMCAEYGENCPVDCADWENMGYESYEDCDCQENGVCE